VSARLEHLRVVALSSGEPVGSAEMRNARPLMNIGFGYTQPDQLVDHDPIKDKHNSQIMNAWRFHTTAAALGRQRSGKATSHDALSDKDVRSSRPS